MLCKRPSHYRPSRLFLTPLESSVHLEGAAEVESRAQSSPFSRLSETLVASEQIRFHPTPPEKKTAERMRGGTVQINWHDLQPVLTLDFHPVSRRLATGGGDHDIKVRHPLSPSSPA